MDPEIFLLPFGLQIAFFCTFLILGLICITIAKSRRSQDNYNGGYTSYNLNYDTTSIEQNVQDRDFQTQYQQAFPGQQSAGFPGQQHAGFSVQQHVGFSVQQQAGFAGQQ